MDEQTTGQPRTGGTVDHPGNLYSPGTGGCPDCGALAVRTVAGGRLTAHGARINVRTDAQAIERWEIRTCTSWGKQAIPS